MVLDLPVLLEAQAEARDLQDPEEEAVAEEVVADNNNLFNKRNSI